MTVEVKERKKYQKMTSAIFVLTVGEYSRTRILHVSPDVKFIAEKYAENVDNYPAVEIWRNNEFICDFIEYNNTNVKQLVKALSKKAMLESGNYVLPNGTIYVFSTGDYSRRTFDAVTPDLKVISKLYVDNIDESPYVEIWNNGEFEHCFGEYNKIENQITKVISMKARGMKTKK